jgi:23S rRNA (guanosine2251-2'-O)-methyltransferase
LKDIKAEGYAIIGLEQAEHSIPLHAFNPPEKIALLLGREVEGIELDLLKQLDKVIEIPMFGTKESFNVVQAAAMCLYHLRFTK